MKSAIIPCPLCGRASSVIASVQPSRQELNLKNSIRSLLYQKGYCPTCGISFHTSRASSLLSRYKNIPAASHKHLEEDIKPIRSFEMDSHQTLNVIEDIPGQFESESNIEEELTVKDGPSENPDNYLQIKFANKALGVHLAFSVDSSSIDETIAPLIKRTIDETLNLCSLISSISSQAAHDEPDKKKTGATKNIRKSKKSPDQEDSSLK